MISRRQQRKGNRLADDLQTNLETARQRWNQTVQPIEQELTAQIETIDQQAEQLDVARHQRSFWQLEHSTATDRLATLNHEIARIEHHADVPTVDRDALRRQPPGREPPGLAR